MSSSLPGPPLLQSWNTNRFPGLTDLQSNYLNMLEDWMPTVLSYVSPTKDVGGPWECFSRGPISEKIISFPSLESDGKFHF